MLELRRHPGRVGWIAMAGILLLVSGCGINNIPTRKQQVDAAWSQVLNEYQRRTDLIPNLVATVKGYAAHEADVLEAVTAARAKVTQTTIPGRWYHSVFYGSYQPVQNFTISEQAQQAPKVSF